MDIVEYQVETYPTDYNANLGANLMVIAGRFLEDWMPLSVTLTSIGTTKDKWN